MAEKNERLEAFRERLRGPKKDKDAWKFWIGSPVAWLAFIVSTGTAYYNLIRVSDDLKAVITHTSFSPDDLTDSGGSISVRFTATFANNGNRPIVIVGSRFKIGNWYDFDRACDQISYSTIEFEAKPKLVKANEAAFDNFGTKDFNGKYGAQSIQEFIGSRLDWMGLNKVLTCLQFDVVTPDGLVASPWSPFLEIYSRRDSDADGLYRRVGHDNPPMILLSPAPGPIAWLRSALASAGSRIFPVPYDWDRNWSLDPPI